MAQFLHGCEVVEMDDGIRSISTVKTAVIGFAFESDAVASAVAAVLTVGSPALDDGITLTAVEAGLDGNGIYLTIIAPTDADQVLSVSVAGKAITVSLATDAESAPTSTATEVVDAINAHAEAKALVTASLTNGNPGTSVAVTVTKQYLSGGDDEPFPVLKPVAITGSLKMAEKIGKSTDAYKSMESIMKQTGALVVAVRAEPKTAQELEGANIIRAIEKFSEARTEVGYKPRILIAPNFSHIDGVAKALETQAAKLRGFAYVDCALNASYTDAMKRARSFGTRVEIQWPHVKVQDSETGAVVPRPTSEFAAGLRCRIDNERGVHWSKSNQEIYGIVGTWQPVEWELNNPNTVANILNENKVSTVIREGGFRFWGNRSCSIDPKWTFECVRRTADMINDSIERAHLWAVDRPGTTQYLQDVIGGVQAYMRQLKFEGIIPGGSTWLDKDLNTPETMAQGVVYFDFDFGVYYPAEHLIFRSRLNNGYLEEVIANV
ncbi:phage tail sheath C-terminal domain-containing protein [Vibrio sp. V39_P1S14PM300]|uniref:phage tail sheath C-terminal domain-containing protein n=1 Tax=Vibrio sp. V39_P1S14PM300 TaxID=1938690 RepID=UPI001372788A|nr:phage tail sheath C-terminal domain-containing protein [Vibrio sp. V39_P1S14PM300]NAX21011.1 phage tail protein [Vibrio sp. V39_P1S14PM300]